MPENNLRTNGLKVVAVGGGHGLPLVLKSALKYAAEVTAIATVADDGGSSGRLRRELGVLPPGDSRNCLVALAGDEQAARLFQYRFQAGAGISGHALGNLIIAALNDITGDFGQALSYAGKWLQARGRVLPPTLEKVSLCAGLRPAGTIRGQCNVANRLRSLNSIWLEPEAPAANPEATTALAAADQIILGPGSLFTSIFPNLLVPEIATAVRASKARRVFVCNTMVQAGETDDFSAADHIKAFHKHFGKGLIDTAVVDKTKLPAAELAAPAVNHIFPVKVDRENLAEMDIEIVLAEVADRNNPTHHDVDKLAAVLSGLVA